MRSLSFWFVLIVALAAMSTTSTPTAQAEEEDISADLPEMHLKLVEQVLIVKIDGGGETVAFDPVRTEVGLVFQVEGGYYSAVTISDDGAQALVVLGQCHMARIAEPDGHGGWIVKKYMVRGCPNQDTHTTRRIAVPDGRIAGTR